MNTSCRKCDKVNIDRIWWQMQLGVILNILLPVSPLAAPHFLLPPWISHQMWRELITNQDGRTDANTHCSSSVNPFITLPSGQTPSSLWWKPWPWHTQIPGLLTNTSLFMEVMTRPSKTFFACPQLSDLLSQQHDFSNEIVSQREEWNQVSGAWIKVILMLWGTGSDCR